MGRIPLDIFARKSATKNWERIKLKHANGLLLASYNDATLENLCWVSNIKDLLECKGMLNLFINSNETKPPFIHKILFRTLSDEFHQNSFENICREDSKLRSYARVKTEIGRETYLTQIKNPEIRTEMTKFRLSNHTLAIETGRHKNVPKDRRFCPFCPKAVETESHFLLLCPSYKTSRAQMLEQVIAFKPSFQFYSIHQKFQYLISHIGECEIYNHISRSFKIRSFLITFPKNPI